MNKFSTILLVLILALTSSCTSVMQSEAKSSPKISDIDGTHKRILVTNYGYYLFNCIPLFCGGTEDGDFQLFRNNVNQTKALNTLTKTCNKLGINELADIQSQTTSTCFFDWAPFGTTFGIYWYREIQIAASVKTPTKEISPDIKLSDSK